MSRFAASASRWIRMWSGGLELEDAGRHLRDDLPAGRVARAVGADGEDVRALRSVDDQCRVIDAAAVVANFVDDGCLRRAGRDSRLPVRLRNERIQPLL